MKRKRFTAIIICFFIHQFCLNGQTYVTPGDTKFDNFQSFTPEQPVEISSELLQLTDPKFYSHPEFGQNPFDTPCEDCFEILNERTDNSRYFVKRGTNGRYFYRQTSNIDLHYKNEKGELITIDYRLKPTPIANVYRADQQSNYTVLNLQDGYAEMELLENNVMRFNSGTTLFSSNSLESSEPGTANKYNYSDFTAGNNGCVIKNAWAGIDVRMIYGNAEVKTNYVIHNLNSIDTESAYSVIDDEVEIPGKMKLMYDEFEGSFNANGIWVGQIIIVDEFEREFARIGKAVLYDDADSVNINEHYDFLMGYKIVEIKGKYHLQTYINNDYLTNPNRIFPVIVDPLVTATTSWLGTNGSNYTPTYCSFAVDVLSPANATITNATIYFEIVADVAGTCGVLAASRCYKDKAQVYFSTACGNSPTTSPFYYYCITAVGGCNSYSTGGGLPWYETKPASELITCLTPQCTAYNIPFTMYLRRTACTAVGCTTTCIRATRFDVTLEGHTIESTMLTGGVDLAAYTITDCVTQTVTFTAGGTYGVSPYTYVWSPSGGTGATDTYTFTGGTTTNVTVTITDACGNTISDLVVVTDPCAPLPVELTSFNGYGQNNKNYLFWTTQSEQNNDSFIIERALDGIHFEPIGSVDGAGNSNAEINYSFIDEKPFAHINYYRLKQLDLNGDYSFSEVVAIYSDAIDKNSVSLNSFNSENSQMDLTVISTTGGGGTFRIVDMTGKTIFQKTVSIEPGINSVLLFPDINSTGAYILSFLKEDMFENIKFER